MVWAAGVIASSLAGVLAERAGLEIDRAGRVEVLEDLSLPGHRNVLALGDMIRVRQSDGSSTAPPRAGARRDATRPPRRARRPRPPPRTPRTTLPLPRQRQPRDDRTRSAVADIKPSGSAASRRGVIWLTVHLWYLIGFENRLLVLTRWAFTFIAHGRGARLITNAGQRPTSAATLLLRPRQKSLYEGTLDASAPLNHNHHQPASPEQPTSVDRDQGEPIRRGRFWPGRVSGVL